MTVPYHRRPPGRDRSLVRLCLSVALVAFLSGCELTTPQGPAVGCSGVRLDQCQLVADVALGALTGHPPVTSIVVGPPPCAAAPCPESLAPGDRLDVTIQFVGAVPTLVTVAATADGFRAVDAGEAGLIELSPSSGPASGGLDARPFALGHCGVGSPIDFDGSFWDPAGWIDVKAGAFDALDGTLVLTTPNTAHFSTAAGFELDLVRHPGPKSFASCA